VQELEMYVNKTRSSSLQSGSTLIVSLLFLMVTTLIATGVWRLAVQQETMTGLERDYQIAFEAAEAALVDADIDIFGLCARSDAAGTAAACTPRVKVGSTDFGLEGATGFGASTGEIPPPGSCSETGLCLANTTVVGQMKVIASQPTMGILDGSAAASEGKRVIFGTYTREPNNPAQLLPLVAAQPAYLIEHVVPGGSGSASANGDKNYLYRSTAIGYGRRADTRVILQSYLKP
jgi:type IV pilus assembly protein PilX